jgi:predicted flap endonuclease-1-like 5' DNA nuclease
MNEIIAALLLTAAGLFGVNHLVTRTGNWWIPLGLLVLGLLAQFLPTLRRRTDYSRAGSASPASQTPAAVFTPPAPPPVLHTPSPAQTQPRVEAAPAPAAEPEMSTAEMAATKPETPLATSEVNPAHSTDELQKQIEQVDVVVEVAALEPDPDLASAPPPQPTVVVSRQDDLTILDGIGPKVAAALNKAGVNTFAELAAMNEDGIKSALEAAGLRFAPTLATWPAQAKLAADGDADGLKTYIARMKAAK